MFLHKGGWQSSLGGSRRGGEGEHQNKMRPKFSSIRGLIPKNEKVQSGRSSNKGKQNRKVAGRLAASRGWGEPGLGTLKKKDGGEMRQINGFKRGGRNAKEKKG